MIVDVVAIYDRIFRQAFQLARPIKASVSEGAKVMEHPIETGGVVSDHRIVLPVEITLSMILTQGEYRAAYNQIYQAFLRMEGFTIETRVGGYRNMIISEIPHEEDPETFDVIPMNLKFREVQFVTAAIVKLPAKKVKKKKQASTVDRGQQAAKTPAPAAEKKSKSLLSRIFD